MDFLNVVVSAESLLLLLVLVIVKGLRSYTPGKKFKQFDKLFDLVMLNAKLFDWQF